MMSSSSSFLVLVVVVFLSSWFSKTYIFIGPLHKGDTHIEKVYLCTKLQSAPCDEGDDDDSGSCLLLVLSLPPFVLYTSSGASNNQTKTLYILVFLFKQFSQP